jgi:phenylacetic acid degradation operon negative regulatory protein
MMYQFRPQTAEEMTARSLVLSLLATVDSDTQPISRLVEAAALFGMEASTMRVAVTRMTKSGLVESPERGVYTAGPKARALSRRAREWQTVEARTRDWLIVLAHHLGRTDRKQLRARERALALSGYRETHEAIWIRPANLALPLGAHRQSLVDIGADDAIRLLQAADTEPASTDWPSLWSTDALAESYTDAMSAMAASLARLPNLPGPDAARETLLIGQAVIRLINFDPLLPPELGKEALFLEMVETMKRYNEAGQACWSTYFDDQNKAR